MVSSQETYPMNTTMSSAKLSATTIKKHQQTSSVTRRYLRSSSMGPMRLATIVACSLCIVACLLPVRPVECGRLQDFIQNLVGGGSSSSNSNSNSNNNANSNSNSNSNNNNESSDSDTAATGESNDQPLTPMMSAMNPFMRYPSFYDSFGPGSYGGYPGMSFSNPMSAMSGMSPIAAMSSNSLNSAFSPASFGPASFGAAFGSTSGNPLSAFANPNGMSASTLSNVYASSPSLMGGYTPYYGRRR